jgi:hypothetical protein
MSQRSAWSVCAALVLSSGVLAATPSTPRLADGHPDLNGVWENGGGIDFLQPQKTANGSICVRDCDAPAPAGAAGAAARPAPDRPKYRSEFQARVAELKQKQVQFDPVLRCRPPGVPRIGPPDKIVQTSREVVFLYEDVSGPFYRIVPLNPKVRRNDESASYLGDAFGHWEGDTLVVETGNFNEDSWLTDDGAFHSAALRVTERLRRVGDVIEYNAIADDPRVLAEPWTLKPRRLVRTDLEFGEPAPCVEQDMALMQDGTYHTNPR